MIQYVSMSAGDLKSTEASLFQLAHYHDVHNSVSKYFRASIMLI